MPYTMAYTVWHTLCIYDVCYAMPYTMAYTVCHTLRVYMMYVHAMARTEIYILYTYIHVLRVRILPIY